MAKKRGRKSKRQYFTEDTELAIIEYLASEDQVFRNKVYNERIHHSFYKLAENLIHTFKFYFYSGQKETKFRTHLPLLIHQAIQTAQEIEFQMWSSGNSVIQQPSKPANASKADKTIRKAKAINVENNPNFNEKTKSIIDSFFTD